MADVRNVGPGSGGIGTGTLTISAIGTPSSGGSLSITAPTLNNANSCLEQRLVSLSSGWNELTVPDNAAYAMIVMPANNAQTVTLKGVTGDTGIALHPCGVFVLALSNTISRTFGIEAGGSVSITVVYF